MKYYIELSDYPFTAREFYPDILEIMIVTERQAYIPLKMLYSLDEMVDFVYDKVDRDICVGAVIDEFDLIKKIENESKNKSYVWNGHTIRLINTRFILQCWKEDI